MLPPCFQTYEFHLNYVAFMLRNANQLQLNLQSPSQHGWTKCSVTQWMTEYFPRDIEDILSTENGDDRNDDDEVDEEEEFGNGIGENDDYLDIYILKILVE